MHKNKYSDYEERLIKLSVEKNLTPESIVKMLSGRSVKSVQKKIYRMGLSYTDPTKNANLSIRTSLKREARIDKREPRDLSFLRINPNLSADWQMAIFYTGAKLTEWKGQIIYTINGLPVSIFHILQKYNEVVKSNS